VRRSAAVLIVSALAAASCGGGEVRFGSTVPVIETTTTVSTSEVAPSTSEVAPSTQAPVASSEIVLTPADAGSTTPVMVGDTIVVRLPEDDPSAGPWILARPADPLVLGAQDASEWEPSETGTETARPEYVFFVLGPGDASLLFERGDMALEFPIAAASD
jgi:hypothetical protein